MFLIVEGLLIYVPINWGATATAASGMGTIPRSGTVVTLEIIHCGLRVFALELIVYYTELYIILSI